MSSMFCTIDSSHLSLRPELQSSIPHARNNLVAHADLLRRGPHEYHEVLDLLVQPAIERRFGPAHTLLHATASMCAASMEAGARDSDEKMQPRVQRASALSSLLAE